MMNSNNLKRTLLLTVVGVLAYKKFKAKKKVNRRWWVRPSLKLRSELGFYETTFEKLKNMDCEKFAESVRMSPQTFDLLLSLVRPRLEKTSVRKPISPECRLFMTLMYLAHGGLRQVYASSFKMGLSTFTNIIYETCKSLWDEFNGIYLAPPNSKHWIDIANEFENYWKLPNCIGAIDGRLINIVCPQNSGCNIKGKYSIVLLAVCDARYSFTMVDIGAYGNQGGGILAESSFGKRLSKNKLGIPQPSILPRSDETFPYFFAGDNAFPLKRNLMRPFSGKLIEEKPDEENYNKRISYARKTIENAFGVLFARWKILNDDIHALPSNVDPMVRATVLLHNILMFLKCDSYCPYNYVDRVVDNEFVPGEWRNETSFKKKRKLPRSRSHNAPREVSQLRKKLCQYLVNS